MASDRRSTFNYSIKVPKVDKLVTMESKLTTIRRANFKSTYGSILDLLHVSVDVMALTTLAQYYDPPLRCFTFQDFQLLPTIEEFESILGVSMDGRVCYLRDVPTPKAVAVALHLDSQDNIPFEVIKNGVQGFSWKTLEDKAQLVQAAGNWKAHNAIVALLVYGLVLFPNVNDFVDLAAIGVFLTGNPAPTLLADFIYSLHARNSTRRGGQICCCAPLIQLWMMSHLPNKGPFLERKNAKWSERLSSLSEKDIRWYSRSLDSSKILLSCGDFPNVPLVGIRGCINYNPVLALRQLGYPMGDIPRADLLTEFILREEIEDLELWGKVKKAWGQARKTIMGKKNCSAAEAYTQWVRDRVKAIKLPFVVVVPSIPQEPEPAVTVPMEEAEALSAKVRELRRKNGEWQMQHFQSQGDIARLKRDRDENEKVILEGQKRIRDAEDKQEKLREALESAGDNLKAKNEEIKGLEYSNRDLSYTWDLAMKAQENWKKKYQEQVQKLQEATQEHKNRLQEEIDVGRKWEELFLLEKHKNREEIKKYEDQMRHLTEKIERMEEDLKQHKLVIDIARQNVTFWKSAFYKLVGLSNAIIALLPKKLKVAEQELPLSSVPEGIKDLVVYCKDLIGKYKDEIRRARRRL